MLSIIGAILFHLFWGAVAITVAVIFGRHVENGLLQVGKGILVNGDRDREAAKKRIEDGRFKS